MTIKKYFSKGVAALLIMISMLCCFSFTACGGDEEVSNVVASETTGTVLIELNIKNAVANRIESKFYVYEDSTPSVYIDSLEINNNSYTASGKVAPDTAPTRACGRWDSCRPPSNG